VTRCAWAVLAIVAAGCGDTGAAPAAAAAKTAPSVAPSAAPGDAAGCVALPFALTTPVPEASGAAWLELDGKPALLVVSDSGNHGAYVIVDAETGATLESGALPLSSEASDDIEGLAARGGEFYGLTSSGWIRVWRRRGKAFELVGKPYPLGPVDWTERSPGRHAGGAVGPEKRSEGRSENNDLPDDKHNDHPPKGDGMVCPGPGINCGRNYEGLCLAPRPPRDACVGFAASKADGHLYCLTDEAGKLVVHRDRAIAVARPGVLADCAFSDDGTLWIGNNLFDLGNVYRVAHWDDPSHASLTRVGALAVGFPEGIAARGDVVYRFSDMGRAPSLMARFRCPP
jgi:hypothetical protein